MICQKIDLYEYYGVERHGANGGYVTVCARSESHELKRRTRPAVLIIPGGCYMGLSDRESEPVALKFIDNGYVSFILQYSLHTKYPTPLYEAEMAISYIRDNAETYQVDAHHVCAAGFSAGGHLTGLLATAKQNEAVLGKTIDEVKPNFVILSYPVISLGKFTHEQSCSVITGGDDSLRTMLSVENRVDPDSVPAFIWHTLQDDAVPVENSLMLANAYRKYSVPFCLHIFEEGSHGLSLANDEVCDFTPEQNYLYDLGKWVALSCDWLRTKGFNVVAK